MMAADTMEALGLKDQFVMKVSNRKILDGLLENLSVGGEIDQTRRFAVLRAADKLDRLGPEGVFLLLTTGRKDESGDVTPGAGLTNAQADNVMRFLGFTHNVGHGYRKDLLLQAKDATNSSWIDWLDSNVNFGETGKQGLEELRHISALVAAAGYNSRIKIDPTVVRGLEYYTGPVFECELLMETKDEDGNTVRFGSVGGGGRYDDLVARFTGQQVPATGFSIGVSRLYSALKLVGKAETEKTLAPVVVLVMDKERQGDYWRFVQQLRNAGIRAEMYVGTAGMKAQMKYADKRGAPLVIIQGGDEKAKGEVQIKDLRLGTELAANISSREEYASQRLAQLSVPESELVEQVRKMLHTTA
jgi:histidyl-tRNA synthetase